MDGDTRFTRLKTDPRFLRLKPKETKIKVDQRFSSVFSDPDFAQKSTVDKYGRKRHHMPDGSEPDFTEMRKFYRLDDDEDEEFRKLAPKGLHRQVKHDPARGEGVIDTSSESESSDSEESSYDEDEESGKYSSIPIIESAQAEIGDASKRLAVVNLDWDNVKAVDLYQVLNSFKPTTGSILSVKIFLSDFGKEKINKETVFGPPSTIFKPLSSKSNDKGKRDENPQPELVDDDLDNFLRPSEGDDFDADELRKYQLERLRYYYAIVECDCTETAMALYNECDGREFESSANFMDLRYVPDHVLFKDDPTDMVDQGDIKYKPLEFGTNVLRHSNVTLTWDEDDPRRIKLTRAKFSKETLDDMDFKAYVASASEDDVDETAPLTNSALSSVIDKYRSLVNHEKENFAYINKDRKTEDEDIDMEVTFSPGMETIEKKKQRGVDEDESVFQATLRKRRDKQKQKKLEDKKEMSADQKDSAALNVKKGSKISRHTTANSSVKTTSKEDGRLELLSMPTNSTASKDHFNLKDIMKSEKLTKNKKKRKDEEKEIDHFEMNVADPRFEAVYHSPQYALDPTHPSFKTTKGMQKILAERRKKISSVNPLDM